METAHYLIIVVAVSLLCGNGNCQATIARLKKNGQESQKKLDD